jgi:hypothetical protein
MFAGGGAPRSRVGLDGVGTPGGSGSGAFGGVFNMNGRACMVEQA